VAQKWTAIRRIIQGPLKVAIGLVWLVLVLHMVIGRVIVRESSLGWLAVQIDRLPPLFARPIFVALWCLFLLGWTVPLFLGVKHLFRRTVGSTR
jgi:hypothetical protein